MEAPARGNCHIREGLLPAGSRTGRNQAEYAEEHVERLSLIRSLRDDAGLSVAAIGQAEILTRVPELVNILRPYGEAVAIIARFEIPDDWQPSEAPNATLRLPSSGPSSGSH